MPRWLIVLKPDSSMRRVYGPLGSAARTNSPLASLTLSRATPVPSCVASTLAPGMTAAELSRTSPTSVAVVTCALTETETKKRAAANSRDLVTVTHIHLVRKIVPLDEDRMKLLI